MTTSQNGWSASPGLALRKLEFNGVAFSPGIRDNDDVETVLRCFVEQYAARVEPLHSPGCWGWSYRENRNDPNSLSNHASGTAIDINAPAHPNGVPTSRTFTPAQIDEVHAILGELDHVLRWGGDYAHTPDAMHVEVNVDAPTLHAAAQRLREDHDMTPDQDARLKRIEDDLKALAAAELRRAQKDRDRDLRIIKLARQGNLNDDQILAELGDDDQPAQPAQPARPAKAGQ